jgi:hypothetical protein
VKDGFTFTKIFETWQKAPLTAAPWKEKRESRAYWIKDRKAEKRQSELSKAYQRDK